VTRRRVGGVDLFFCVRIQKAVTSHSVIVLLGAFRRRSARAPSVQSDRHSREVFGCQCQELFIYGGGTSRPHDGGDSRVISELALCLIWRTQSLSRCFAIRRSRSGTRLRPVDVTRTGEFRSRASQTTTSSRARLTRDEERARSADAMRLR